MNGIDNIKQRILKEAEDSVLLIQKESDEKLAALKADAKAAAEKETAAILEKGKTAALSEEKRIISSLSSELRLNALKEKQAIIDEAFELAQKKLDALSGSEYQALLVKLIAENAASGKEELLLCEGDRNIAPAVLKAANEALEKKGIAGELTLSEQAAPYKRGVGLRLGISEVNCSLDTMADSMRDSLTKEIAELLFS